VVWELISDPYNLPRWWPRASRVEGVEREGEDAQWTMVLETAEGRGVRADFRCSVFVPGSSYGWEQQLSGTPFERHLRAAGVALELAAADDGTAIELTVSQSLRGLSRLGGPLMRRAQGEMAEAALDGIEDALTGGGGSR
jgi:uncharacterized protein YndB with AHSA1/START domain